MPVTTLATAGVILNRVAAEVGIEPVSDPYGASDPSFVQLQYLLNAAGEELLMSHEWALVTKSHQILTQALDTGDYPLPDDFFSMINQTGWEQTSNVPLFGPLSAQDWTFLKGRALVTKTIYASFRLNDGLFRIYPQPPPEGLDINFEYLSKNWVSDTGQPPTYKDEVTVGSDTVLFDKTLITRYLKVKYLEAKGFDSTKAQDDFTTTFSFITGKEKGAPVLSAGRTMRSFPYLDPYRNVGDSFYGDWN